MTYTSCGHALRFLGTLPHFEFHEDFGMPTENHFQHQQYPTEPVTTPIQRTLNVEEADETDFSTLHTALRIGRVILVHGT